MALFAGHIFTGNQQLCHSMVIFAKQLVIGIHQLTLPHRGGCLFRWDVCWALTQPQLPHAHANGTGGHQNHLMSRVFDVTDHPAQLCHPPDVQVTRGMGQGGCANFHHNAHRYPSIKEI